MDWRTRGRDLASEVVASGTHPARLHDLDFRARISTERCQGDLDALNVGVDAATGIYLQRPDGQEEYVTAAWMHAMTALSDGWEEYAREVNGGWDGALVAVKEGDKRR